MWHAPDGGDDFRASDCGEDRNAARSTKTIILARAAILRSCCIRWTVLEWQYRGKYEQLRRSRKACFTLTIFKHAFASAPLREPYARISHVICEGGFNLLIDLRDEATGERFAICCRRHEN